jgi:zinc D-Ala-D-Ala dipeptidase
MRLGAPEPMAALNRVRIVEAGEPLVDVRDHCPGVQVLETVCPYLRRAVADMVNRAQTLLPAGHKLRISTALRTLAQQKAFWDAYFARMRDEHADWPLSALRRATNRFFAPYDQPAPPGHCTGGAVDVQILGPDGQPLDLTSPLQGWAAAYTWTEGISPEARRNRMVLVETMLAAGFSNCREEFWHYSYGDSAWAARVGVGQCPYGLVEPPVSVEARFTGGLAAHIHRGSDGTWTCRALDGPGGRALYVGVFWSLGRPVALSLESLGPGPVFVRREGDEWRPLESPPSAGAHRVDLVPDGERVYVASPMPPEPEPTQG